MGYRDYSVAKGLIVDATGHGDFTDLAPALAASVSGQTIFMRPGTYTGNYNLVAGVDIVAFDADAQRPNVTIIGKCSFATAGTVSISGIRLETNSDFCVSITGSASSTIKLNNCFILASNNTAISNASSSGSTINLFYCSGNVSSSSSAFYITSSTSGMNFQFCNIGTNSSTVASTQSAGTVNFLYSTYTGVISLSGSSSMTAYWTRIGQQPLNTSAVTLSGTSSAVFENSYLESVTPAALSIGSGCNSSIFNSAINSSNTNAITGSGTLKYGGIDFISSSGINVTTQNPIAYSIQQGGTSVTSVTTTPTATAFAGWDANANLSANSFIEGYATTATAAGTTTLTVASTEQQYFTGITTQTVLMPVTSTLVLGQTYRIVNKSTGVVTVESSGANAIQAMAVNTQLLLTVINTGVTTAAAWDAQYSFESGGAIVNINGDSGSVSGNPVTFTGVSAGSSVKFSGTGSTMSLEATDSNFNTIVGLSAGNSSISGSSNSFFGFSAGNAMTGGGQNAIFGADGGLKLRTGNENAGCGFQVLSQLTTGSFNAVLGQNAGNSYTSSESSNVLLNSTGIVGESHVLRIGAGTGTGNQQLSTAFIQGIVGATLAAGSPTPHLMLTDTSNSQLICSTPVQASAASSTFGSLVIGTALQNTANYPILINVSVAVTASTTAAILVGVGSTSTPTAQSVIPSFTTASFTPLNFSFVVPSKYFAEVTTTGTITVGSITTFVSQIG